MFMFEICDKEFFEDGIMFESEFVFIKAYDEYEAEFRCNELFPKEFYKCYYEDEYTEEEAEILGYDIF